MRRVPRSNQRESRVPANPVPILPQPPTHHFPSVVQALPEQLSVIVEENSTTDSASTVSIQIYKAVLYIFNWPVA